MSYQVLALKYRPQTFDEVVGQPHVTTTLSNAITSDRMAHAIIFTGPRGTGKTTIARILAKAMNCKNGPVPQPCNKCKICQDIIEGHCTDVFEIDGASNNSVDQIRDLRENVTYMPSSAKYKIYIIDEVHMLSTAAFNALLKTLEEPPEHVMFIFATTEVHKIPATILSRCQRHDLNRISLNLISDHLQFLCTQEGFSVENQSLDLIAQEADGSIRDSLSLLDRLLSSATTKEIDHKSVLDGLGILDGQIMHELSCAIFENNGARLIEIIEEVNDSGIDLKKHYSDLILHFRNLNIVKICGKDSPAVNITTFEKEKILEIISSVSKDFLNTILQILLEEESIVKYSSHTKTAIEMILLKLLQVNPGAQIDRIIDKLDILSNQIGTGLDAGPIAADKVITSRTKTNPEDIQTQSHHQARQTGSKPAPVSKSRQNTKQLDTTNNHPSQEPDQQVVQEPILHPGYQAEQQTQEENPENKTWQSFLNKLEKKLPFMFALMSKGFINQKDPDKIIVELKNCSSFHKTRLEKKKDELQTMCKEFLGKNLIINIISETKKITQEKNKSQIKAKQAAFNHPLVVEAQKIFDGAIINY